MQPKPKPHLDVPSSLAVAALHPYTPRTAARVHLVLRRTPISAPRPLAVRAERDDVWRILMRVSATSPRAPSWNTQSRRPILVSVPSDACRRLMGNNARNGPFATCQAHARRRNEPSPRRGAPPVPPDACSTRCLVSRLALSIAAQSRRQIRARWATQSLSSAAADRYLYKRS